MKHHYPGCQGGPDCDCDAREDAEASADCERELAELRQIIRDFCEGQKWAAQEWKNQAHIKPLFDAQKTPKMNGKED